MIKYPMHQISKQHMSCVMMHYERQSDNSDNI